MPGLMRVTEDTNARGALDSARDLAVHGEQYGYRRIVHRVVGGQKTALSARSYWRRSLSGDFRGRALLGPAGYRASLDFLSASTSAVSGTAAWRREAGVPRRCL
jgi:hypothetical protein